ncbi:hypothetical protein [Pseudoalteromonas sp. PS5]|uniref:hypothetical protein n=1 Tax=Pseudoalteromonas sp. PS5 TaxID=1437473 RepID=UPI000FFECC7F|nr:hypothetical protein [Pseudoalteromonas sp. PS5]
MMFGFKLLTYRSNGRYITIRRDSLLFILLVLVKLLGCSEQQKVDSKISKQVVDEWNAKIEGQRQKSNNYNDFKDWLSSNTPKEDKKSTMIKSLTGTSNYVTLDTIASKTDPNCYIDISLQFEVSVDSIVEHYKVSATQVCRYKNTI